MWGSAAVLATLFLVSPLEASVLSRSKRQADPCPDKCKDVPLDISFVVDASSSISKENFTEGLWFIQNFVDKFDIGPDKVRVSMVTFADQIYRYDAFGFDTHTDKARLNMALTQTPHRAGSATETGMAINWFLDNHLPQARPGVRRVVIVLTDGNSQKPGVTKDAADRALGMGLEVFAIGVGHSISEQELHNIASDGRHVFLVGSYKMLDDIMSRLAFETCGVRPQPDCQFDPVDIAMVIDASRSIGKENFTLGLEFIKEFLNTFVINPSSIRVAAVMFADRVYGELALPFDRYTNKKDTLDAILGLPYMNGPRTETGMGIDYMVGNFVPNTRPHAAHIGIVITDGESQKPWKTADSALAARNAGLTMYAVGVGSLDSNLSEEELTNIAGDRSRVLTAANYASLNLIKEELTKITCVGIELAIQQKQESFDTTVLVQ